MPTLHAFDWLSAAEPSLPAVCVLFGDEPFLKQQVLNRLRKLLQRDADDPAAIFDVEERVPEWRDIHDELATASLFGGGGKRVVILQRADPFVSAQRSRLEDYVAKPRNSGVLILEVGSWAANTRLYKSVDQTGLQIDCGPPMKTVGKNKVVDEGKLTAWLTRHAKEEHQIVMKGIAAEILLDLVGPNLGLLAQDVAKLALYVPAGGEVSGDLVQTAIGGWRAKTSWDAVDAAVEGNAAEALLQLDHLLQSGEHPLALFGSISWSLRRYAAATRAYQKHERRGNKIPLAQALQEAGFKDWPLGTLKKAEQRLIQLGRQRAGSLYRWLLEADLAMKGTHSQEQRSRFVLEQLFLRLARK